MCTPGLITSSPMPLPSVLHSTWVVEEIATKTHVYRLPCEVRRERVNLGGVTWCGNSRQRSPPHRLCRRATASPFHQQRLLHHRRGDSRYDFLRSLSKHARRATERTATAQTTTPNATCPLFPHHTPTRDEAPITPGHTLPPHHTTTQRLPQAAFEVTGFATSPPALDTFSCTPAHPPLMRAAA